MRWDFHFHQHTSTTQNLFLHHESYESIRFEQQNINKKLINDRYTRNEEWLFISLVTYCKSVKVTPENVIFEFLKKILFNERFEIVLNQWDKKILKGTCWQYNFTWSLWRRKQSKMFNDLNQLSKSNFNSVTTNKNLVLSLTYSRKSIEKTEVR